MTQFRWEPGVVQTMEVCGHSLETVCFGLPPAAAPTLILLHEGLGCLSLWRDFPERLSEATGYGVFVYSRAGYGQSSSIPLPRPLNYMSLEAELVLPEVIDLIEPERVILVGHSDGASIAAIYAGRVVDERLSALVLIAPHFFTEPGQLAAIRDARSAYLQKGLRDKLARYHADVDCAFRGWNDAWLDTQFKSWNISSVIDSWCVPALVLQGADDQYGTLAQIREIEQRSSLPVQTSIMESCGHAPHLEHGAHSLVTIARFAAELDESSDQDKKASH